MKGTTKAITLNVALVLIIVTAMGNAGPYDTWTWRNPLPTGQTLTAVACGGGKYVAFDADNNTGLVTSVDGMNWTQRRLSPPLNVAAIAYGIGEFVAVGGSGNFGMVLTSTDGTNWTLRYEAANFLEAITYANGQFVAVGDAATILTSPDGVTWTPRESGTTNSIMQIVYGNGHYVGVCPGTLTFSNGQYVVTGNVLTSSDGVSWTNASLIGVQGGFISTVTYGNGLFVAGTAPDQLLLTSTDGVIWTKQQQFDTSGYVLSLTYGDGFFVAVGDGILTSVDGTNWAGVRLETTNYLWSVAYGNDQFVAVGDFGTILISTDGTNWVAREPHGPQINLRAIAYGNRQFVAVGDPDGILTSADAVNWVSRPSGVTNSLNAIAYGEGEFVAVGSAGIILTSADGVSWVPRRSEVTNSLNAVVWGNGQFVVAGDLGIILSSPDGDNWVSRLLGGTNNLALLAYGNAQFVAASDNLGNPGPNIATSIDATNWAWRNVFQEGGTLSCVAFGNGQFVGLEEFACGGPCSSVVSSSDGLTWVEHQATSSSPYAYFTKPAIAFGSAQFVFAANGFLWNSADGSNWVAHSDFDPTPFGICYGNEHFVSVGEHGAIRESGGIITLALTPGPVSGSLTLSLTGPIGSAQTIQSSSDLISWQTVTNLIPVQPTTAIPFAPPTNSEPVFFRAYSQ